MSAPDPQTGKRRPSRTRGLLGPNKGHKKRLDGGTLFSLDHATRTPQNTLRMMTENETQWSDISAPFPFPTPILPGFFSLPENFPKEFAFPIWLALGVISQLGRK